MKMLVVVFLLCVCYVCAKVSLTEPSKDANDDQYAFLAELYENTSGEMWANNSNWLVRNESITLCDWYGITCAGKWVEKIKLNKNGLGGPLPNHWERVPYIDYLDFSGNKLLGTIPESIGNLSLGSLLLSGNSLSGTIPSSLGKSNVEILYLDNNRFTGTLPSAIAASKLFALTLDNNKLTGTVPAQFGQIGSQLMLISAAFNSFVGTLPEGVCHANACSFLYNAHLGCPNQNACVKCGLPLCNCGHVCYSSGDCAGGSCPTCSANRFGVNTCGGQ